MSFANMEGDLFPQSGALSLWLLDERGLVKGDRGGALGVDLDVTPPS